MKKSVSVVLSLLAVVAFADLGIAGGKADGEKCHVSKSCNSKLCITFQPQDKFGVCCTPVSCVGVGAQCGELSDGCARQLDCGTCDSGSTCINNACVPTTTLPPTTLPPTTLAPPTTLPPPPVTTTTIGAARSCVGYCDTSGGRVVPPGTGPDCYCDYLACGNGDGCSDFLGTCVQAPPYVCD